MIFVPGAIVLAPVIAGLGIEASVAAISEGITEIPIGAAAFAP